MQNISENDIAIIGMAGRFPKAANINEYWQNLVQGINSVESADKEKIAASGLPEELLSNKRFVNARSKLEDGRFFDADFFRLSKAEAVLLDPQIRLLLQTSYHAIEDAGYDLDRMEATVGNFCGMSTNSYLMRIVDTKSLIEGADPLLYRILNEKDFLATWISYKLNLTGPAMTLQTACSTSLLAVHQACQSLINFECDMALAGGSTYDSSEQVGYIHIPESIYAKDGVCRPFDKNASGTVMGEGVGAVLLKRAVDAMEDGDNIYVLIKGTAVNNDGANKQGYTTPSVDCQRDVILEALGVGDIRPETIGLIEAHGTGTLIGDPIEISALTEAYQEHTEKRNYCAIGSVKGNIGHLDAAAGVASLIKAALCVNKGELVPSINYSEPNPALNLESSPFYVSEKHSKWPEHFGVRRAGISSLGVGGTNVHVIVEQPPVIDKKFTEDGSSFVMCLSAQTEGGLQQQKKQLATYLRAHLELNLADVAYTTLYSRRQMTNRFSAVSTSVKGLIAQLEGEDHENTFAGHSEEPVQSIFLFPGQGSQYPGMASTLYETNAAFRLDMDQCFTHLSALAGKDFKDLIFDGEAKELEQTANTQIALFLVEYCLAKATMRTGIKPTALVGHSLGEYVAACIAGCLSLEDALKLIYHRGRLMGAQPGGSMLLVRLPEEELKPMLEEGASICVMNSQDNIVIGGSDEAIEQQTIIFNINDIKTRKLEVSHAYHTPMMEGALAEYEEILREVAFSEPEHTIYSTFTGKMVNPGEFTSPQYWLDQILNPVKFMQAIEGVNEHNSNPVYIEVGPGNGLSSFVKAIVGKEAQTVNLMPRGKGADTSTTSFQSGRAMLFAKGVNFTAPEKPVGNRVKLPGYAFTKQYFWKPHLNIQYKGFEDIKQSYHQTNEHYLSDRVKITVEIQVGGRKEIPPALLDKMNELHTQYINGIKELLGDQQDALQSDIQVMYEDGSHAGQETATEDKASATESTLSSVYQAPKTETEKAIAVHWEDVLGYQPDGVLDNYFEAGGNSLLATQLINRLISDFDMELTITEVLENPTIKDLAVLVDEKVWMIKDEELTNELII